MFSFLFMIFFEEFMFKLINTTEKVNVLEMFCLEKKKIGN